MHDVGGVHREEGPGLGTRETAMTLTDPGRRYSGVVTSGFLLCHPRLPGVSPHSVSPTHCHLTTKEALVALTDTSGWTMQFISSVSCLFNSRPATE